jgi:hypothetical protein
LRTELTSDFEACASAFDGEFPRRHLLLPQSMTRGVIHVFCASFGVDGKQFIHPLYDARSGHVLPIQLHRIDELSSQV